MTRAQYLALCVIGGIAVVAYIRSEQIIKYLGIATPGGINKPGSWQI